MKSDERTVRELRNLLPYLKDWAAWQREVRRLERNVVKLRKQGYSKLARTLDRSLVGLKRVLAEERRQHAFTVNKLIHQIDRTRSLSKHSRTRGRSNRDI